MVLTSFVRVQQAQRCPRLWTSLASPTTQSCVTCRRCGQSRRGMVGDPGGAAQDGQAISLMQRYAALPQPSRHDGRSHTVIKGVVGAPPAIQSGLSFAYAVAMASPSFGLRL